MSSSSLSVSGKPDSDLEKKHMTWGVRGGGGGSYLENKQH